MNSTVNIGDTCYSAREVARRLKDGAVALLPTETVYGLAALPDFEEAMQRIYRLKGRPGGLKLPVVVGNVDQLDGLGVAFCRNARLLAQAFWPGPLTLVMGFSINLTRPRWLAGRQEVAIRMPALDLLREVALACGPFFLTSANRHGDGEKTTVKDALKSLLAAPDLVVDGGRLSPQPSTIVNTRMQPICIERCGAIDSEQVRKVLYPETTREI